MRTHSFAVLLLALLVPFCTAATHEVLGEFERPGVQPMAGLTYVASEGNYYGTTSEGGIHDYGTVFRLTPDGKATTLLSFSGRTGTVRGASPDAGLTLGPDGALYGVTLSGGANDFGTLFKVTTAGVWTPLVDFTGSSGVAKGSVPNELIYHADGNFYGTTQAGGVNDAGTVFRFSPVNNALTTLVELTGTTGNRKGSGPIGALVANGSTLYGVTQTGGTADYGTVFRVTTGGSSWATLAEFTGTAGGKRGSYPAAGLLLHADGALYGTTEFGGTDDCGTIFRVVPLTYAFTTLYQFADADGAYPAGALLLGTDLALYGTTSAGGADGYGTIFKLLPVLHTYLPVADFTGNGGALKGAAPRATLCYGALGEIVGSTSAGGAGNAGTLFKINLLSLVEHVADFTTPMGWEPSGAPVASTPGEVLVPLARGGADGNGTLLRVPSGGPMSAAATFSQPLGEKPAGGLLSIGGSFYGVTETGGTQDRGTFFRHTPAEINAETTTLVSFNYSGGCMPEGPVTVGSDGFFYTVTREGGAHGRGAIVRLGANGGRMTVVSFTGLAGAVPGAAPRAPLAVGADGNLYGVTESGGTENCGTLFVLTPEGSLTTLVQFVASGPNSPRAGLTTGKDGALYGTTALGGSAGHGTVFRFDPAGGLTTLVEFTGGGLEKPGSQPAAPLLLAFDGTFYGTTTRGGAGGYGTVFRLAPDGTFSQLHSFSGSSGLNRGAAPVGGLNFGLDGLLYGATSAGGTLGGGTVYRFKQFGPHAVTETATFAAGVVTLRGRAQTGGEATTAVFEYGPTPALGQMMIAVITADIAASNGTIAFSAALNALPAGQTVYYRARAANVSGVSTGEIRTFTLTSPIEAWKTAHLGDPNAPDLDDPDGDGVKTLLEYGLGTDPSQPDALAHPVPTLQDYAEGRRLTMTLLRDPARFDITVTVEAASELAGPWTIVAASVQGAPFSGPGYVGGDDTGPAVKTVLIRDVFPAASTQRSRFLRVKVSR